MAVDNFRSFNQYLVGANLSVPTTPGVGLVRRVASQVPTRNSSILCVAMVALFRMKRAWRRRISAGTALALLLAQLSVAAYACPDLGTSRSAGAVTMTEHCHDGGSMLDPQHPAVCHEQCKPQANVDHRIQPFDLPPAAPSELIIASIDARHLISHSRNAGRDSLRANGPPLSILFCVSRT